MIVADVQDLLPGYSSDEIEQVLAAGRTRRFSAGSLLYREGAPGSSCFFVVSGALDVVKSVDGDDRVLATMRPGTLVGQTALVPDALRSATVRAQTAATTLEFRRGTFLRLLRETRPFALRMQEQIAVSGIRQLRAAADKLALVLAESVRSSRKRPTPLDRQALALISACTGEWDVPLAPGARTSALLRKRMA
jgi:CRP-like cAMP-binding protein